ncbi:hypothetical protein CEY16_09765 [Halalkalibacillus sediminis]|uniref:Permease n=1 Tax=Halalkalibacillus sediminis TaxID=2018042 RepID=A0A2I0QRR5_9BACI|nr:hypothetical protein [Halalkalibacillus sediminis]PKR77026.1 hypothetical protein CEY16_09765 [Halalkalibacillus sediminis]
MGTKIICKWCKKEIEQQSELIVTNSKMLLRPYHKKCFDTYSEKKKREALFFDAIPLNSTYSNWMTVIFLLLLASFYLFLDVPRVAYILCAIFPIYRLLSFLLFEIRAPRM